MFLILSTIYIFIPVRGCIGKGFSALLCPGAYDVKTVLFVVFNPTFNNISIISYLFMKRKFKQ